MDPRVEIICSRVAEGALLREVGAELGITAGRCIQVIHEGGEESAKLYARAREHASDLLEQGILVAAEEVTSESAAAHRVKIDALKWVAARRSPKKYGDRIDHTTGGDKLPAAQTIDLSKLPSDVLRAVLAASDNPDA